MDASSKLAPASHRLLYRGALALPDSHLQLDGLSFTVKTGDAHGSPALLNNTLALTLESLRGLPLHLLGEVRVRETWIDPPGDIHIDIHPDSALTRIYFENIFCSAPITSPDGRTEYGVRVSLTENNDPDTPDLLIYGELRDASAASGVPVASTSLASPKTLHLLAARILPGPPPPPSFRLPRPDDPTPRRPPAALGAKRKRETSGVPFDLSGTAESSKRSKGADGKGKARASALDEDALRRNAAETMLRMPKPKTTVSAAGSLNLKALGKDARVGVKKGADRDVFKVPSVPARSGIGRTASETDVFGSLNGGPLEGVMKDTGVERENKNAIKKIVSQKLSEQGISKTHAEFKELFQMCYQGTSFALRHKINVVPLKGDTIDHFVDAHIRLYVCGELSRLLSDSGPSH